MQLARALRFALTPNPSPKLGEGRIGEGIAFVGAGGKTTAMFQLARELRSKVIVTATSHLGVWQIPLADHHIVAETPDEIGEIPEDVTLVTGPMEGDRTKPVNSSVLSWLREETQKRNTPLLIEADGARQKPLKAPAEHEPPIPDFVEMVVVVAGLSGLGKPVTEEFVFRADIFKQLSESNEEVVTPEMLVRVLTHPEGGLKNIPAQARRVALLNQAETPELQAIGGRMAGELLKHFDAVLVDSLQQNNFQTFEQTAGIILAAGESTRFGRPKQLLDWRGKPFVRQVAETALSAGLQPVVVVTGANAEGVENAVQGLDVNIVRNEHWQSGQASSIVAGITSLPRNIGACLFLLADQPQIGTDVIRALMESHAQNLPSILAPLVLEEKRANPVLFDRVTFPDLLQLTGDVGGRAIFGKYRVEYLPWHDEALLLDVDTPEDYERLKGL
jgi:molybdenum cofactor cytidylyltransferase